MNDEIQVTNRTLLIACFAAIIELMEKNGVKYEAYSGSSGTWKVIVYGSQNPDILDLSYEYPSWTFAQSRDDAHMQSALVSAQSFVNITLPGLRDAKTDFDFEYERLKEKFGTAFPQFLSRATSRNEEENYQSSSWSSSSENCW